MLATLVDAGRWLVGRAPKLFIAKDGTVMGFGADDPDLAAALGKEMPNLLRNRQPTLVKVADFMGEELEFFLEPVVGRMTLFIFGGGHVSQQVAPLAAYVDFNVVVADDRPEFSNPLLFPNAQETLVMDFECVMEKLPIDETSWAPLKHRSLEFPCLGGAPNP
jgi:xanthine dehydrogenase accessory factor